MPDSPDIRVAPVTPALAGAVRALRVAPEQYPYVGDVEFNLIDAERDPQSDAMAVLADGQVIGFYRLDHAPTLVTCQPLPAGIGLRAFLIDRAHQGRGLGSRAIAAACRDIERRYPGKRILGLNVDCRNVAAVRAYRKAGFVDSGELYFGGSAGPQQLMLRRLGPVPAMAVGESRDG